MAGERKPKKSTGLWRCFRVPYKMLSSHIGLTLVLLAYSFAGAAMFQAIEGRHERQEKLDVLEMRKDVIQKLWNSSIKVKVDGAKFSNLVENQLKRYEGQLYKAFGQGVITEAEVEVWDFWQSLFFCATVYTTIGYGNFAPVTKAGRVATIIYALVGIPLCLVVMADFGRLFTRILKFFWAFVRRFYYTGSCQKIVGTVRKRSENETETESEDAFVVDDEFNLPPIIAVVITLLYIMLGAAVLIQWEDWDYLESFYFVFISISTIGFGDVLPDHPKRFMAAFVYLLFGLSLVAMLINVIMEVVTNTIDKAKTRVLSVGKTIGLNLDVADSGAEEEEEPGKKAD